MSEQRVVIVGGGHSGLHVAASLRTQSYTGSIIVIDELGGLPYERPPLSKDVLDLSIEPRTTPLRKANFYEIKQVKLVSGIAVIRIDRDGQQVVLEDGSVIGYEALVLATGSVASTLHVSGASFAAVRTLRTFDDAIRIRRHLEQKSRIVIIGAGYIGLEVAAAAAKANCRVTVLEFQDRVMKRVTSPPVSNFFEAVHSAHGVDIRLGAGVSSIEQNSLVTEVVTDDADRFEADLVVAGVGVTPNDALAKSAGLACADGILVDRDGRTSDPTIFACGDVTRFQDVAVGQTVRLECVSNALAQGARVSRAIIGISGSAVEIPWFWTVQYDERLQTAGVQLPSDEIVVRGEVSSGKFSVLYLRNGALAALDTVNSLTDFMAGKRLIASGAPINPIIAGDSERKLVESIKEGVAVHESNY